MDVAHQRHVRAQPLIMRSINVSTQLNSAHGLASIEYGNQCDLDVITLAMKHITAMVVGGSVFVVCGVTMERF